MYGDSACLSKVPDEVLSEGGIAEESYLHVNKLQMRCLSALQVAVFTNEERNT